MNASVRDTRVLAIDPATRGYGFAVLEGPRRLVDWGVASVRRNKRALSLTRLAAQIRLFRPGVVVLPDPADGRHPRCARVRELIHAMQALAAKEEIKTRLISRAHVVSLFAPLGADTKHEIAVAIARRFPAELAHRVPPPRRPWMPEHHNMPIFDALALALAWFHCHEKEHHPRH